MLRSSQRFIAVEPMETIETQIIEPQITAFALTAKPISFTDGDILISILLVTQIIIMIFGGLHNVIFGVKQKKQNYD